MKYQTAFRHDSIKHNVGKKYVDYFIGLRSAADMLALRLFPNGKEVTESMAMFSAVRNVVCSKTLVDFGDPEVKLVAVGDGTMPRTAALFAFMTNWQCWSIDPVLNKKFDESQVSRLHLIRDVVQNANLDFGDSTVIIVMPHSHAQNKDVLNGIGFRAATIVAMPCCVHQPPFSNTFEAYFDEDVWSPKNQVIISYNVKKGSVE